MKQTILLLAAFGCTEFALDPLERAAPNRAFVTEEQIQLPLPGLDVLFVIDDTGSMAGEQRTLGEGFGRMAARLDEEELSWQVGVTTTDLQTSDAGWLVGEPWVLTSGLPDVASRFAEIAAVGTDGAPPEAGIAAALLALEHAEPGGPNAGFRRAEAALHVVFVSDSDDSSDAWLSDPVADAVARLDAIPNEVRVSALVGPGPTGCIGPSGTARHGTRYIALADQMGGVVASICQADFAPILESFALAIVSYQKAFYLDTTPVPGTLRVFVDEEQATSGWQLEADPVRVVFTSPPEAGSILRFTYVVEV